MTDAERRATRVQSALRLPDEIPPERMASILVRTLWGVVFVALGLGMMGVAIKIYYAERDLNLWLFGVGVFFFGLGSNLASNQLVGRAIVSLANPVRVVRELVKGKDA